MVMTATAAQQIKKQLRKADARDLLEIEAFDSDLVQRRAVDVAVERRVDAINHCISAVRENCNGGARRRMASSGSSVGIARSHSAPPMALHRIGFVERAA